MASPNSECRMNASFGRSKGFLDFARNDSLGALFGVLGLSWLPCHQNGRGDSSTLLRCAQNDRCGECGVPVGIGLLWRHQGAVASPNAEFCDRRIPQAQWSGVMLKRIVSSTGNAHLLTTREPGGISAFIKHKKTDEILV